MNSLEGNLLKKDTPESSGKNKLRGSLFGLELAPPGSAKQTKEHLGHIVVSGEAKDASVSRRIEISPSKIDTMNRAELIELSETIEINGSNLKKIFETRLIGENGLRRLIKEYLRGSDVKELLAQEITQHEKDFERDPAMRDLPSPADGMSSEDLMSSDNLSSLIDLAEANMEDSGEEAYYRAKAQLERKQLAKTRHSIKKVDYLMFASVTFLLLAILIILIVKR